MNTIESTCIFYIVFLYTLFLSYLFFHFSIDMGWGGGGGEGGDCYGNGAVCH
jgi:hypothetical protein